MTKKIFRAILGTALLALFLSFLCATLFLYDYFSQLQRTQLKSQIELAKAGVELSGSEYLEGLDADDFRVTLVAADGEVLYDSEADAETMTNHKDREEISEALQTGTGSSSRYSSTLMRQTIYEAVRLNDGTVLRLSCDHATVGGLLLSMLTPMAAILILTVVISILMAGRLSKRVVEPLVSIDLDRPLENDSYEEISPLLRRIGEQHRQIDEQLDELRRRNREFHQITESMREGLVLLNGNMNILAINPAAEKIFNAREDCVGKNFLTVDRRTDISRALDKAVESGHSDIRAERNGREYQFDCSRVESAGGVSGAVLLAFDVTEQARAEQNRREFTANVSHELKTPVQSILGSAELLKSGLVKPEDSQKFTENIYREASRLVTLIGDIIRLSQLDEESEMPGEDVNLFSLASDEVNSLTTAAMQKQVELSLDGELVTLHGPRQLYREIIHNLCDNAVKYNVPGGRVNVKVEPYGRGARLVVADTGIGIPPEDQSRVFERFYRVDKSRSKETGGTGLGLSIVKHAVQDLGGSISLESALGKGTKITVLLGNR